MKVAFLFPGQGSQQPGMGAELLQDAEIAELSRRCSQAAGVDLGWLLLEASDGDLRLTHNAQPALCFTGIALARLLARRGIRPLAAAGHSVGEYAALCVGGAISAEDALRAVGERGQAMADAVPAGETSMAAVLGLDLEAVTGALAGIAEVWPANVNTPAQIVIAGRAGALETAGAALREAGARRVIPLNVSAAFHSPFMRPAATRLRRTLDGLAWAGPRATVIANVDARPHGAGASIPDRLERQLYSPVLWGACVTALGELGCDTFYELGPKRALTGMMRDLLPGALAVSVPSATAAAGLELSGPPLR